MSKAFICFKTSYKTAKLIFCKLLLLGLMGLPTLLVGGETIEQPSETIEKKQSKKVQGEKAQSQKKEKKQVKKEERKTKIKGIAIGVGALAGGILLGGIVVHAKETKKVEEATKKLVTSEKLSADMQTNIGKKIQLLNDAMLKESHLNDEVAQLKNELNNQKKIDISQAKKISAQEKKIGILNQTVIDKAELVQKAEQERENFEKKVAELLKEVEKQKNAAKSSIPRLKFKRLGGSKQNENEKKAYAKQTFMKRKVDDFFRLNDSLYNLWKYMQRKDYKDWILSKSRMKAWIEDNKKEWKFDLAKSEKLKANKEDERKNNSDDDPVARWKKACELNNWTKPLQWHDDLSVKKYEKFDPKNPNYRHIYLTNYIYHVRKNFKTFGQFAKKIEKLGKEMVSKIKNNKKVTDIFLLVPGVAKKSSAFIFFSMWKYLGEFLFSKEGASINCHFISPKDENEKIDKSLLFYLLKKKNGMTIKQFSKSLENGDYMTFIFDDALYSGAQLHKEIEKLNFSPEAAKNFYLVTPYMSYVAQRVLMYNDAKKRKNLGKLTDEEKEWKEKNSHITFMEATEYIEGFYTNGLLMSLPQKNAFWIPLLLGGVKIADDVSTARSGYIFSELWSVDEENKRIDNHEPRSLFAYKEAGSQHYKDHNYNEAEKKEIEEFRIEREQANNDNYPDHLLPIPTIYKKEKYIYQNAYGQLIWIEPRKNKHFCTKGTFQALEEM